MANGTPSEPGGPRQPRGEVLVTGAAGFIGAHLARACHQAGWAVTALDIREPPTVISNAAAYVTGPSDTASVLGDLRAGRYAAAIHHGAITSTMETDWDLLREVNVRQSLAVADACAAGGAAFIYASSHSVYGRILRRAPVAEGSEHDPAVCTGPLNLYARSKLDLDLAMTGRRAGAQAPWIGLRYTNVFGTGEGHKGSMASILSQMLRAAAEGRRIRLFEDTMHASRDYLPVETVTDVVVSLLSSQIASGIYNLGSGCPVSFATVLDWCTEFAGQPADVAMVPNPVPESYQYWTCANVAQLSGSLPGFRAPDRAKIRGAAHRLFRSIQEHGDEQAGQTGH